MDVSIIFVNYKTKDLTINAINSVMEKTVGIECEIFVVDNNSQDGSIEEIQEIFGGIELPLTPNISPKEQESKNRKLPHIQYSSSKDVPVYIIKNPTNAGFGTANNIAIRQAKGKYILCLNTDTLLINNAIKEMFDFLENNHNVGVCGGNLYDTDKNPTMSYATFPNFWNCLSISWLLKKIFPILRNHKEIKEVKEVDFITGADIFFRKSVLDEIGLFDEQFFMYAEEVDLCKRIKNAKYEIKIIPNAKIIHLEGKSAKNFWNNTKMRVKSKYLYARKHQQISNIIGMKFSYIFLHFFSFIFTFNKEHIELIQLHWKG